MNEKYNVGAAVGKRGTFPHGLPGGGRFLFHAAARTASSSMAG